MVIDPVTVSAGMATLKSGLDTVKTALGIIKDVKDRLPNGEQRNRISVALEQAAEKMAEGEAAVASALGYTLCRCAFPPTPMLMVGHIQIRHLSGMDKGTVLSRVPQVGGGLTGSIAVHECPKCRSTDAPGYPFQPLIKNLPLDK